MTESQRKEALERVGQDIHWLLSFLETSKKSFLRLPELEALQTLFYQHFTLQDSQKACLKDKAETGKDKIQSPHEPEARYSEKRGKSWIGYKTHFHGLMIGTAVNLKRLVKAISLSKNNQNQQLAVT